MCRTTVSAIAPHRHGLFGRHARRDQRNFRLEIIGGAPARVVAFGVADETAWEVGLACGGRVEVFVEAVT